MGSLWLLVLLLMLCGFQQWRFHRDMKSYREGARIRRALFRGEAFAHNYRMWKRVYREILDIGEEAKCHQSK